MKIGIIDIGSNSVRLLLWADGKTLYKKMTSTRLGEGLNATGRISAPAAERTSDAVAAFVSEAISCGADEVFAFATAAVRSAENPEIFLNAVKDKCGITVDVISGETEAACGLFGALGGGDGGIIDVGGASTEVTVRRRGEVVYAKSLPVGTVRISDAAGRDMNKIRAFVSERIADYGEFDFGGESFFAVGGTATRLAAIKHGIKSYDPQITHLTRLSREEIYSLADRLTTMPVDEIRANTICGKSADIVGGGAMLLAMIMDKLKIESIAVSEHDNLEGYLYLKTTAGRNKK